MPQVCTTNDHAEIPSESACNGHCYSYWWVICSDTGLASRGQEWTENTSAGRRSSPSETLPFGVCTSTGA